MKTALALLLGTFVAACGEETASAPPPNQPVNTQVGTTPNPTFSPPPPVQSAASAAPVAPAKTAAKVMLTADECKSAQKKLEPLKQEDMTTKDSLELFLFLKAANCEKAPPTVTEAQRSCLAFPNYVKASFVTCVTP